MSVRVVAATFKNDGGSKTVAVMYDENSVTAFGPVLDGDDCAFRLRAFVGWAGLTSMRSEAEVWGLFEDFQRIAMRCGKCGEWGAGTFCHECGDALTPESHAAGKQESVQRA